MADYTGRELDFNDSIEKDSQFTEIPEGEYDFQIDHWERGRVSDESEKYAGMNMAIVYVNIIIPGQEAVQLRENFILHSAFEWKLSQLFTSVGLKKKGEAIVMKWDSLPGLTGRCKVTLTPDKKNPDRSYNHVGEFYPKEETRKFTPGKF